MASPHVNLMERGYEGNFIFPELSLKGVKNNTVSDTKENRRDLLEKLTLYRSKKVSKSNRVMFEKMGASHEFMKVRYNLSYKPVLDIIGTDIPLHPEYFYIINHICGFYGYTFTDVFQYAGWIKNTEYRGTGVNSSVQRKRVNINLKTCFMMLVYFLLAQYKCAVTVLMDIFNAECHTINAALEQAIVLFENSPSIRMDYNELYNRLLKLEK